MANEYTIKQKAISAGGYIGIGPRSMQNAHYQTLDFLVTDSDTGAIVDPDKIDEQTLLIETADQTPTVNETVYTVTDPATSVVKVIPWLIATSKRVERTQSQRSLFRVIVEFSSGNREKLTETDFHLIPAPTDSVTELPYLREKVWGAEDRPIFEESVSSGQNPMRLPTNSLFSEPFTRRWATQRIRQSQFEAIDPADLETRILERLFSVPTTLWNGIAATPPRWMITDIEYQRVKVAASAGPDPLEGYLMTYLIDRTDRDGGFYDRRVLIDNYYLENPNDLSSKTLARDPTDGTTVIDVLLDQDGTKLADQNAAKPEYKDFKVQPETDWSFLRDD